MSVPVVGTDGYGCQGAVVMITGVASCVSVLDLARHAAESIPNARTSSLLVRLTCTDANMHTSYNKYVHRIYIYSIHKSYPYYILYILKYFLIFLYYIYIWYNTHMYIYTYVCVLESCCVFLMGFSKWQPLRFGRPLWRLPKERSPERAALCRPSPGTMGPLDHGEYDITRVPSPSSESLSWCQEVQFHYGL